MAKTFGDAATIMRRVIGENDGNDPDATSDLILDYLGNAYQFIMGQEIKSFDLYTWFEFTTTVGEETYTFKDQGYTNIMPPVYCIDSNNGDTRVNYFQDTESFYRRHPVNDANEDSGRPFDLLFFNNEITIRPKADAVYTIKMRAYKELQAPTTSTTNLEQDYFLRYLAYTAALDYFADFGNIEDYAKYEGIQKRYKNLVLMRTAKQATTQRTKQAL